jgi:hypothetical protein
MDARRARRILRIQFHFTAAVAMCAGIFGCQRPAPTPADGPSPALRDTHEVVLTATDRLLRDLRARAEFMDLSLCLNPGVVAHDTVLVRRLIELTGTPNPRPDHQLYECLNAVSPAAPAPGIAVLIQDVQIRRMQARVTFGAHARQSILSGASVTLQQQNGRWTADEPSLVFQ